MLYNATGCMIKDNIMVKSSCLTLADIAKIANVSKSTVSRALSDSSLIAVETRERIQKIARENNYCLNAAAKSLSLQRSNTIGFVSSCYYLDYSVADLFDFEIMGGITNALYAKGYDLLILQVDSRRTDWAHRYLDGGRVDGFILMTGARKQNHVKACIEADAPFVIWGVPEPDCHCSSVTGDNFKGTRLSTDYLIKQGRKRIAFIGGPEDDLEVQQRFKGYEFELTQAGRLVDQKMIAYGDYSMSYSRTAMIELLQNSPDIDAVVVCGDLMAIAAMDEIQKSGRKIPDDIAVIGYDDLSIGNLSNPPLTTISQHVEKAGRLLAETLLQQLETGIVNNVTVPVELIKRQSA
jgi:DNA-binding LacI/PurR family transcriptional regulator